MLAVGTKVIVIMDERANEVITVAVIKVGNGDGSEMVMVVRW